MFSLGIFKYFVLLFILSVRFGDQLDLTRYLAMNKHVNMEDSEIVEKMSVLPRETIMKKYDVFQIF